MKRRIAICLLAALMLAVFSAQAYEAYRYGTYIGVDDIDNDMFLLPYDEPGLYQVEIYLGDSGRSFEGTARQHGNQLSIKANYSGSIPRYTGTVEIIGQNEYRVSLYDSYNANRRESYIFCWVSY